MGLVEANYMMPVMDLVRRLEGGRGAQEFGSEVIPLSAESTRFTEMPKKERKAWTPHLSAAGHLCQ